MLTKVKLQWLDIFKATYIYLEPKNTIIWFLNFVCTYPKNAINLNNNWRETNWILQLKDYYIYY